MENQKEYIDKMLIKLTVLESKIQKLESLTEEVVNEVNSKYHQQLTELSLKKEEAEQKLKKMREVGDGK